jgi:hypothetical protein
MSLAEIAVEKIIPASKHHLFYDVAAAQGATQR